MKKQFILSLFTIISLTGNAYADATACPEGSQVFVRNGTRYFPHAPEGWHLYYGSMPNRLHSDKVNFGLAHWGDHHSERMGTIRCYYANPEFGEPNRAYGVAIEYDNLVGRGRIDANPNWSGNLCASYVAHNVYDCVFA